MSTETSEAKEWREFDGAEPCTLCEERVAIEEHHTSYDPPETILVCRGCHMKIHKTDGFHDDLLPEDDRGDLEYGFTTVTLMMGDYKALQMVTNAYGYDSKSAFIRDACRARDSRDVLPDEFTQEAFEGVDIEQGPEKDALECW